MFSVKFARNVTYKMLCMLLVARKQSKLSHCEVTQNAICMCSASPERSRNKAVPGRAIRQQRQTCVQRVPPITFTQYTSHLGVDGNPKHDAESRISEKQENNQKR